MDPEIRKIRWLLAAGLTFLISGCFAYEELRYSIWGRQAEGRVSEAKHVKVEERGGSREYLGVNYSFSEEGGGRRSERDLVHPDSQVAEGSTIPIHYIPGEPKSSRVAGNRKMGAVYTFFGCLAVIAFFLYRLAREANEPIRPQRKVGTRPRP